MERVRELITHRARANRGQCSSNSCSSSSQVGLVVGVAAGEKGWFKWGMARSGDSTIAAGADNFVLLLLPQLVPPPLSHDNSRVPVL